MTRIFAILALFAVLFVGATAILGLSLGDIRNPQDRDAQHWATVHRLSGVAAALAVMFVNGIAATYFIGTSRWCREVVETYGLDPALWRRSTSLKRRTFPLCVANMLLAVVMVALGGAADPGASVQLQPIGGITWAQIHLVAAFAGLAWFVYSSTLQWNNIQANRDVIDAIMIEVRRERAARGLE
ncbi:MAG: hypothetical protein AB7U73_00130 [Pirellulales bacterium]